MNATNYETTRRLCDDISAIKIIKRMDWKLVIMIDAVLVSYSANFNQVRVTFRDWNGRDTLRIEYNGDADFAWVKRNILANVRMIAKEK